MKCELCGKSIKVKDYIDHLHKEHPTRYEYFIDEMVSLNNRGYTIQDISDRLKISKTIVSDAFVNVMEPKNEYLTHPPLNIKSWAPDDFKLEATTSWSFKKRGNWATHNGKYRGNWSPYIPRNLILRYSDEEDTVLDPFLGSGTTLIETKLLKRKGIGLDINPDAISLAKQNLRFNKNDKYHPQIYQADARELSLLDNNSIDLICAHPPYANIIKYSEDIAGDLSHLDIDDFLVAIAECAKEMYRVLKNDKYCAILIGDTRRNKHMIPLGFKVMEQFLNVGFVLKENIIKEQHNCQATGFWYHRSIQFNFLLIAHEYLFVFRKP